ncbi:hypothetical protein Kisp02_02150 [Kineosporia sp. NBRC 101731]|nr:Rho termination factor N-terminal domain-containing protein [Kineosporia sp. NBRC 101731]GLY26850.1 hypothetical protein Kisp02_02150 [Kineosporia sp. NBRC 101731]
METGNGLKMGLHDHSQGGKSGDYDDWSVDQLRKRAAAVGVTGRSSMKKAELISALRNS